MIKNNKKEISSTINSFTWTDKLKEFQAVSYERHKYFNSRVREELNRLNRKPSPPDHD